MDIEQVAEQEKAADEAEEERDREKAEATGTAG